MKPLEKTGAIRAKLAALDPDLDIDKVSVFEAVALNDKPLRKRHPLYMNAVAGSDLLYEMAAVLNKDTLPVHLGHNSSEMPKGRVFDSRVTMSDGVMENRVLFYLPSDSQEVRDIELGLISEVSSSILPKRLLCSDCGFDFFGDDNEENLWSGTCNNKHQLGKKSTHGRMGGLQQWFELSLVGRGGAVGSKLVSDRESLLKHGTAQKLAASGRDVDILVLQSSIGAGVKMDVDKLVADLTAASRAQGAAETKVGQLEAQLIDLNKGFEAARARLATLEPLESEVVKLRAAKEDLDKAVAVLDGIARRGAIALGQQNPTVPTDVSALVAMIQQTQANLTAIIPTGGRATPAAVLNAGGSPSDAFNLRR